MMINTGHVVLREVKNDMTSVDRYPFITPIVGWSSFQSCHFV